MAGLFQHGNDPVNQQGAKEGLANKVSKEDLGVELVRMQRYKTNPNHANKIKQEIDDLLKARFIAEVESTN